VPGRGQDCLEGELGDQTDVLALSMPSIGNYLLRVEGTLRDLKSNKKVGIQTLKYLTIHCLGNN